LSWQFLSIHLTISFLVIYSGKWIIEGKKSGFRRKGYWLQYHCI
jgi:hypothetical protein